MNRELVVPPPETALGSLIAYITDSARRDFQPMNANYGLMPELKRRARGREKENPDGHARAGGNRRVDRAQPDRASLQLWLSAHLSYRKSLEVRR